MSSPEKKKSSASNSFAASPSRLVAEGDSVRIDALKKLSQQMEDFLKVSVIEPAMPSSAKKGDAGGISKQEAALVQTPIIYPAEEEKIKDDVVEAPQNVYAQPPVDPELTASQLKNDPIPKNEYRSPIKPSPVAPRSAERYRATPPRFNAEALPATTSFAHYGSVSRDPTISMIGAAGTSKAVLSALQSLQQKIRQLEAEKRFYRESQELCEKENSKLRHQIIDVRKQADKMVSEKESRIMSERQELLKTIGALRDQTKVLDEELSRMHKELHDAQLDKKHSDAKVAEIDREMQKKTWDIERLQKDIMDKVAEERNRVMELEGRYQQQTEELELQKTLRIRAETEKQKGEDAVRNLIQLNERLYSGEHATAPEEKKPVRKKRPSSAVPAKRATAENGPREVRKKLTFTRSFAPPSGKGVSRVPMRSRRTAKKAVSKKGKKTPGEQVDMDATTVISSLELEKEVLQERYDQLMSTAKQNPLSMAADSEVYQTVQAVISELDRKNEQLEKLKRYHSNVINSPYSRLISPARPPRQGKYKR